jgi:hypothetical protein
MRTSKIWKSAMTVTTLSLNADDTRCRGDGARL